MDKVLVSEVLYAQGHKKLNENYIRCISQNYSITLVDDGKYFCGVNDSFIEERIFVKVKMVPRVERFKSLCHAINLANIARIAKKRGINTVILLSFHTEGYLMARHFFNGLKVVVVHHYEIDRMTKNPKEIKWFDKYKNEIYHCVLEDFITEGLIKEFKVSSDRVFTVNTPVDMVESKKDKRVNNTFIGIGQSTDQVLVDELIQLDRENYIQSDTPAKIILRSKMTSYKGKNVEVFTGFLERDEYDRLYQNATACIIRYEPTYKLRSSGSIDDAFRNHKKAIVTGFPAGVSYSRMYPNNCLCVNSSEDIMDMLIGATHVYDEIEGKRFERIHSFENVSEQWKAVISSPN